MEEDRWLAYVAWGLVVLFGLLAHAASAKMLVSFWYSHNPADALTAVIMGGAGYMILNGMWKTRPWKEV